MKPGKSSHCVLSENIGHLPGSVIRSENGGGPKTSWLPWDATKPGAVLKAKAPSPARHIAESSCRLRRVSAGEGLKRGVGSEGLAGAKDMERPGFSKGVRECSYVLHSGSHQRALTVGRSTLGRPFYSERPDFHGDFQAQKHAARPSKKNRATGEGVR